MMIFKLVFIFLIAEFIKNVMSFNPLLTYIVRFKKVNFYPNTTANITINQYKNQQYVSGNIKIDSTEVNKAIVIFHRCNPEGINCEYFQSWTFEDICSKLKEKNQIWSSWYGAYEPPMVCPIDKVHYQLKNATLNINSIVKWYADAINYQWKVTQNFYAGDAYVNSVKMEISIFGYRKKSITFPIH